MFLMLVVRIIHTIVCTNSDTFSTISRHDAGGAHEGPVDCAAVHNAWWYSYLVLQPYCLGRLAAQNRIYEGREKNISVYKGKKSAVYRNATYRRRQAGGERKIIHEGLRSLRHYFISAQAPENFFLFYFLLFLIILLFCHLFFQQACELSN